MKVKSSSEAGRGHKYQFINIKRDREFLDSKHQEEENEKMICGEKYQQHWGTQKLKYSRRDIAIGQQEQGTGETGEDNHQFIRTRGTTVRSSACKQSQTTNNLITSSTFTM